MNVLHRIVATKRGEVALLRRRAGELRDRAEGAEPSDRSLGGALRRPDTVALLAEVKRRSPSAGWIREDAEPHAIAEAYVEAGAAAISVLTDAEYFGGSLDDLERVRSAVALPVLRKDFVVDPLQLWEARGAGADAALLIVRILDDAMLRDLHALAHEIGLEVLVEVHDERELERALAAEARVVGVNNRDLSTFTTDLGITLRVAREVPSEIVLVAESGIRDAADVERLGASGVDAVLVGETLMRAPDIAEAAAPLAAVPKAAERA